MKKIILISFIVTILSGIAMIPKFQTLNGEDKVSFVIIYLGGPDAGTEGKKIITDFLTTLSKVSGLNINSIQGEYFNNINAAKNYIKNNKNSFIMGSIGFFLANRKSLNLKPLAIVKMSGDDKEQYFMVIKKGKYSSLKEMKGKILAGNVLYEDTKFINTMIFNSIIDVSSYFTLKPTQQPLTAIRRVSTDIYDAALVNQMQLQGLKKSPPLLPLYNSLQVVHQSPRIPALGLMMIDTPKNRSVENSVVNAITVLCSREDGKSVCANFGIDGFYKIQPGAINNEIKRYDEASN